MADEPPPLPDDALVVRGGQNLPENFADGSGVALGEGNILEGVSVNAAAGASLDDLTAPVSELGYPGIPHGQIGVTTVGAIRAAGGDVVPSPRKRNPTHATLRGLTPEQASQLFRPLRPNPSRKKK